MSVPAANMPNRRLTGRAASAGQVFAPLHRLAPISIAQPAAVSRGRLGLDEALQAARTDLEALAASESGAAADIVGFQLALLADPELNRGARALIAAGHPADEAWLAVTAAEVDGFLASGTEMLQARAADLIDLCKRVLSHIRSTPAARTAPPGHVVLADDLAPTEFLSLDWTGSGLLLRHGSPSSHLAVLARGRGVPMVVDIGDADASEAAYAFIDGDCGIAVLHATGAAGAIVEHPARGVVSALPQAVTADGIAVEVTVNISTLEELHGLDRRACDGIGLVRTEFLLDEAGLASEERQLAAYRALLAWAGRGPVRIRTVDAGMDKPTHRSVKVASGSAGIRGLRLSLRRPELFRVQLRALARAAAEAPGLLVLFPMVTTPAEFDAARSLFDAEVAALRQRGIAAAMPPLGVMIEVPAAALAPELFGGAAYFAIGSNDLFQYAMAIPREDASLVSLAGVDHPAMGRLVAAVTAAGRALSVPVSVCGDVAADPRMTEWLLSCGVRSLSVAPPALESVQATVRAVSVTRNWSRPGP